jgi:hypothetical protein
MTSDFIIYSTAMVRWNKPYDEFFVGTNSGLWRFDEDLGTFVCEWYWTWDPLCKIASIGNGICGIVSSWGSQSGIHVWKPDGTHTFKSAGARFGDLNIWGDPISHKYGYDWDYYTRIAPSGKSSITLKMDSGKSAYSLNGGVKFYSPVGTRKDKEDFSYFDDFRPYTNSTVILKPVNLRSGGLIMGNLGGYFYPIPIQCEELDTFFYSPNTRLMIAGLARENKLFYAVLPEPNTIWLPKLHTKNIPGKTIVSWDSKQNPLRLEMSTNKVSWKKVTNRKITEHGVTKVVVPDYKHRLHFRLVHP